MTPGWSFTVSAQPLKLAVRPPIDPTRPIGCAQHAGGHPLRRPLQHVDDKRPADALTVEVALVDAQMVEHREMVVCVVVPASSLSVIGARRTSASGIALIHDDDAVVLRPFGDRVDRRHRLAPHTAIVERRPAGAKVRIGKPLPSAPRNGCERRDDRCSGISGVPFAAGVGATIANAPAPRQRSSASAHFVCADATSTGDSRYRLGKSCFNAATLGRSLIAI